MNYLNFVKKYAALPALFISGFLEASTLGLIGGQDTPITGPAYAAIVSQSGGITPLTPLPGISSFSAIDSVAMNSSGQGLIGGKDFTAPFPAYAALVSPAGTVTQLTLPGISSPSIIKSVALNSSSVGLIGGQTGISSYAALVSPLGVVTQLTLPTPGPGGQINSVAINSSSQSLVGGQKGATAYAALVSPSGVGMELTLPGSPSPTNINSVAISSSSVGLIGGQATFSAYAAFVSPSGTVTQLTLPAVSSGNITSVAISSSSQGLIGGNAYGGLAYAALVSPSGTVTQLTLPGISTGSIRSVAMNSFSLGLIGGQSGSTHSAYAAFVSPSGAVMQLNLASGFSAGNSGIINTVAINDFGQGLIGGDDLITHAGYAALVSPAGQVIPLNLGLSKRNIASVALLMSLIPTTGLSGNNRAFANYINKNAPYDAFYFVPAYFDGTLAQALESAAPTRNAFSIFTADNNVFYLDTLLSNHNRNARNARRQAHHLAHTKERKETAQAEPTIGITSEELLGWGAPSQKQKQVDSTPARAACKEHSFETWVEAFGALAYQKKQHQTPAFNPTTGGMILGFDGKTSLHNRVGTGAAYTYTYIHEKQDAGHSRINQEYLFLYTSWDNTRWYVDTALMGGLFQVHNVRKISMTGFEFQSQSRVKGGQLAPHFETGYDYNFYDRKFTVEPFVMLDWVSNWQDSYKEHGSGPFNAGQKRHYSSFLRSETGLRFYETIRYDSGNFTMEEKLSYVNKKPFKVGSVNAFLVGAPGSFTVETLTTTQNLGVAELEFVYQPHKRRYPCTTLAYQGEFGSMYQSHIVSLELSWNF